MLSLAMHVASIHSQSMILLFLSKLACLIHVYNFAATSLLFVGKILSFMCERGVVSKLKLKSPLIPMVLFVLRRETSRKRVVVAIAAKSMPQQPRPNEANQTIQGMPLPKLRLRQTDMLAR